LKITITVTDPSGTSLFTADTPATAEELFAPGPSHPPGLLRTIAVFWNHALDLD
jgi:hypothetical protein